HFAVVRGGAPRRARIATAPPPFGCRSLLLRHRPVSHFPARPSDGSRGTGAPPNKRRVLATSARAPPLCERTAERRARHKEKTTMATRRNFTPAEREQHQAERRAKLERAKSLLEQGLTQLQTSDEWRALLERIAKNIRHKLGFARYSFS